MDNATGMATKYLLEMLNIGGKRDESRESEAEKQNDKKDGEESVSMSVTSSTASASQQMKSMSDMSLSVGEIPGFLDGSTPRISLHPVNQKIHLTSNDEDNGVSVFGNYVEVVTSQNTSSSSSITASNKIKINQMVKYDWDLKFYRGNLIALGNPFIAYTLKGRNGYVIRLLNPETASRALIKGFTGLVSDLAFAHHNSKTLACVDEGGNIFVWNVSEEDNKIEYKVKLHINRSSSPMSEYHRVFWCPYLPDDDDEEEEEEGDKKGFDDLDDRSLVVTHDNKAEVIDIAMVVARCNCSEVSLEMLQQGEGYVSIIDGHTKPITDGSLSPDNAVLATASEDGYVRFWEISDMMPDGEHNCVHEFQPHGGAPLSSLVFCDNHLVHEKEVPMWRFMITGAEYNREIKIWCTIKWTCLQTLRFTSPTTDIESVLGGSYFKIQLDLTARYLVLSDIGRRVLYVLLVHQNRAEGKAHVTSISDFQLTQPLLSFVITKAKLFRLKSFDHEVQENGDGGVSNDVYDAESPDELEESELDSLEKRKNLMVQLRMYSIHTKTLQELLVHFQPEPSVAPRTPSIMSSLNTSIGQGVRDALSDLSGNMDTGTETSTDIDESDEASSEKSAPLQPKLISPEAFTHLSKDSSRPDSSASNVSSATLVSALNLSHNSVEDSVTSSVTSKVSEITARSSVQDEMPHTFYGQHSGILTPTSLPLPGTPPFSVAPDPTAIPIPMFTTSPMTSTSDDLMRQSPKGDVGRMNASPVQELRLTQEKKEIEEAEPEEDQERMSTPVAEVNEDDSQQSLASIPKEPIAAKDVSNSDSSDEPFTEDTSHKERKLVENTVSEMDSMNFTWMTATDRHSPHDETPVKYKRRNLEAGLASTPVSRVDIPPESSRQLVDQNIFSSLNELVHLVKSQQQQITSLRQELNDHQAKEHQSLSDLIQGQVARLEDTMIDRINGGLAQHSMEENQRLEKSIKDRHTQDKKKHEQLLSTLSQAVTNSITGKLDKTLKQEMKNNLIPTIQKAIIPIQEQLNTTMVQKLTAADTVLKDSAYKMVKNKGVIDAIGNSAASALQGPIQATYREAFQNTILPAFERACQSMFQQINDAFQKGTHQYLEKVTLSLESQGKKDTRDIDQVMSQVQLLRAETQRHSSSLINDVEGVLQKQLATALHSLREEMLTRFESQVKNSVQEIVRSEVKEALREVRQTYSEAPVPETVPQQPTVDTKTQITELIQSGNFSQAFQEALTAADLSLVVFVCDSIDSNELFSQGSSPLTQPVLLSLIQQLSVDLLTQTELKHRYLMEAVMSLDTANEVTREHMPAVLQGLFQQLGYAISECTGATQKSLKVLQMAAQSLLR